MKKLPSLTRFAWRLLALWLSLLALGLTAGCGEAQEKSPQPSRPTDLDSSFDVVRGAARRMFMKGDFSTAAEKFESLPADRLSEHDNFTLAEIYFANGQAPESVAAFDRVLEVNPQLKPQLWQRGLALYYANRCEDVIDQLESHQSYNTQDVENSVWHMISKAKVTSVQEARKGMIKITQDGRIAMPEIYEMFAGRGTVDQVLQTADSSGNPSTIYHANLYIGLFHEMMGDAEKSQAAILVALSKNPFGPTVFMGNVARMHAKARGYAGKNDADKKEPEK